MLTCQEERRKRCFRYENAKMMVKEKKSFNDYQLTMVMRGSESMMLASAVPPESSGGGSGGNRRNQRRRLKMKVVQSEKSLDDCQLTMVMKGS